MPSVVFLSQPTPIYDATNDTVIIHIFRFGVARPTMLLAEDMNYEAEINKLEKEAEERLETKVKELMSNIATSGAATK